MLYDAATTTTQQIAGWMQQHGWQPLKHTCSRYVTQVTDRASGAASGGRREASPLCVGVQKLCNMCALSLSWNFFVSHDKYIARPSSHVDTQTIQPGLGDFVL